MEDVISTKWTMVLPLRIRSPQTGETPISLLLTLPKGLQLMITNKCSFVDGIMLSHTCRNLYNIFRRSRPQKWVVRNKEEFGKYISQYLRQFPEHWLCIKCNQLHDVFLDDTPTKHFEPICPYRMEPSLFLGNRNYQLHQRHVHLAVIYSQLENRTLRQNTYLDRLLEPYQAVMDDKPVPFDAIVRYRVVPKIVDSRFILFSQCQVNIERNPLYDTRQSFWLRGIVEDFDRNANLDHHRGKGQCSWQNNLIHCRAKSIAARCSTGETEFRGHCNECRLAYDIMMSYDTAIVSTWVDLGTGDSPYGSPWSIQLGRIKKSEQNKNDAKSSKLRIDTLRARFEAV